MKRLLLGLCALLWCALCNAQAIESPKCWPLKLNVKQFNVPSEITSRFDTLAVWACDKPDGIHNWFHYFAWDQFKPWARAGVTAAEADAQYAAKAVPLTDLERSYGQSVLGVYGATTSVAANGTSLSRPVYTVLADGTRTLVSGARVAVGAKCRHWQRSGNYYSVEGQENVATAALDTLGPVYALCKVTAPYGVN